jgi:vacuolar-type H+-ATPase subunit F/Vma7
MDTEKLSHDELIALVRQQIAIIEYLRADIARLARRVEELERLSETPTFITIPPPGPENYVTRGIGSVRRRTRRGDAK